MLKLSILNTSLKMFDSRLQAYLSGVNELTDIFSQRTATWKSLSRDFSIFILLFTLIGYVPKSPLLFVLLLQSILLFKYSFEVKTKLIETSLENIWCK